MIISKVVNKERAYKDPDVVRPNLENISNNLKWKPSTNIETGVEKTVTWYLNNKDFQAVFGMTKAKFKKLKRWTFRVDSDRSSKRRDYSTLRIYF